MPSLSKIILLQQHFFIFNFSILKLENTISKFKVKMKSKLESSNYIDIMITIDYWKDSHFIN